MLGCTRGVETTIIVHGKKAVEEGASIQEVGEALRLCMMICGVSAVIPAAVCLRNSKRRLSKPL